MTTHELNNWLKVHINYIPENSYIKFDDSYIDQKQFENRSILNLEKLPDGSFGISNIESNIQMVEN